MDNFELNNLKDYLRLFNSLSEKCFKRCVYTLGQIKLSNEEAGCLDTCIVKSLKVNTKLLNLYMEINPQFQERKMKEQQEEMAKIMADAEAQALKEGVPSPVEATPVSN